VKRPLTVAIAAACVCAAAFAVPALGGPSIATVAKKAALALKLARAADKRSKNALGLAQRGAGRQPGGNGTPGPAGPTGPPGPAGPAGAQKIDFRAAAGTADTKVLDFGGLVLTARCDSGPNLSVNASSTVANSELHISGDRILPGGGTTVTPVYLDNDHLGPNSPPVSFPPGNFQGTFTYSTPAGVVVTGTVAAEQTAFSGATACWFGGWAVHDPA
jgi:hypothetical protein